MPRALIPDWMITPAYGRELTFERVAINEGALCIECRACGRRITRGNKTAVKSVTFRCQIRYAVGVSSSPRLPGAPCLVAGVFLWRAQNYLPSSARPLAHGLPARRMARLIAA
jgi:hypothetical protein